MKRVAIVSLFPEAFGALTNYGVTGRAIKQGLLGLSFINPRNFTKDKHQTVDDRPYGGGPGMVMKIEPLEAAIEAAKRSLGDHVRVVYLSPQGQILTQVKVKQVVDTPQYKDLILISGRYEGIDERLIEAVVDEEWSIGDYVLSGGELPAMVALDAIIRLLPGALGHEDSAQQDSFGAEGLQAGLLDCPHYTRPEDYRGQSVPEVLLSGNHKEIKKWRLQQSLGRTWLRRPELLENVELTVEQADLLAAFKENYKSASIKN